MRFVAWAGVAATMVLGCGGASRSGVRQVSGSLSVEPAVVDFGDVALGKEDRRVLTVRNDGLVSMVVDQLPGNFADGAFDTVGLPANLPPGGSAEVRVTYHPQQTGSHARQISLMTDSPDATPAAVGLRGRAVLGLAQLSGDAVDFGPVVVGHRSTQSIALLNNDGKATTDIAVAPPQGDGAAAFSCSTQGKTSLAAEQSIKVNLFFEPPRLGAFGAIVPVTPCPTCSPRKVTLIGLGVERLIDVQPSAIDFGEVRLGTSSSKPFSVTNTSKSPLTVTTFAVAGATAMTATFGGAPQSTIQAGQTITGLVRFAPVELGQQSAKTTIGVSDGAAGTIDLTGLGMGAVIDTLPHDAYLDAVALGTSRSLRVRIFNLGLDPHATTPLAISGASVQSASAGWSVASPAAPWTVGEPGSTSFVDVSFQPQVEGLSNAKLVLQSNDALHPVWSVPLSALARKLQPCKLSVAPGTVADFGDVAVNQPSTQGFELTNAGVDDCVVGEPSFSTGFPTFHFPGDVAPSGRTLPPGGRMSLRIEFTPQREQNYSGGVDFYVSNPAAPSMHLGLKGNGDAGCFFVAPGAVDFGGAQSGCSAPQQQAYAVNHCAGPVTVTGVQTSGAPFTIGSNAPAVPFQVASNTSVAIPIDYRAASPGDDVGQLIVSSDVRPGAKYKVGLTAGSQADQSINDSWDQSSPKVDLLLVIDNSGSMDDEQAALQQNLPRLWNRIALAKADYHIAVTTTGMSPYTQGWTQCPGGASGGEAGRFFPVDGSRPRILTPQTPNVRDMLFANTNVGLCHWDERGTEPLIAALTDPLVNAAKAPGTPFAADGNAGFLRADARLAVLTISDANDYDDVPNPPSVASQAAQIIAIKNGALDLISYSAIIPMTNCPSVESQGTRYVEMAQALRGKTYDVCDLPNFGVMLDNALNDLLLPLTSFPLSTHPRDPAQIQVAVNGVPVAGFSYDATTNRIVFARANAPAPGTHITARYLAACR